MLGKDKRSSLFNPFLSYEEKKVYKIEPKSVSDEEKTVLLTLGPNYKTLRIHNLQKVDIFCNRLVSFLIESLAH
jgi:hypothetical protein